MEYKRADKIADALEEMVFTGAFQDGQRLDETSLAKTFGVSRTPVREALQRLVAADLARQMPRRGVFVRQPSADALVEIFEAMAEVEGVCGRLAALRMTEDGLEQLRVLNSRCETSITYDDPNAYARHNDAFHHLIFKLAQNTFLEIEAQKLYRRLKPFRRLKFRMRGRMTASVAEHNKLVDAFATGATEEAAAILRDHVATQGDRFYRQMAELKRAPGIRNAS